MAEIIGYGYGKYRNLITNGVMGLLLGKRSEIPGVTYLSSIFPRAPSGSGNRRKKTRPPLPGTVFASWQKYGLSHSPSLVLPGEAHIEVEGTFASFPQRG